MSDEPKVIDVVRETGTSTRTFVNGKPEPPKPHRSRALLVVTAPARESVMLEEVLLEKRA